MINLPTNFRQRWWDTELTNYNHHLTILQVMFKVQSPAHHSIFHLHEFLSPPVHVARWAHTRRHFLSVCLSLDITILSPFSAPALISAPPCFCE